MRFSAKQKIVIASFLAVAAAVAGAWYWHGRPPARPEAPSTGGRPVAQAEYVCNGGKTVSASFYQGPAAPVQPGEPPKPSGSVKLALDDGRSLELAQTLSADGGRYANADESFVFWSKGNGATILENNAEHDYAGCVTAAADPGGLPQVYHDGQRGFTVRYPADFVLNADYEYQALGPGKGIKGVKFVIPAKTAEGKNLSSFDTGVSVEALSGVKDCQAGLFLSGGTEMPVKTVTENGTDYSFATSTEGAAGNRYEESVWTLPGAEPCLAVRYLIHSTVLENYPPGTVTAFDHDALVGLFDKIRRTLTVR